MRPTEHIFFSQNLMVFMTSTQGLRKIDSDNSSFARIFCYFVVLLSVMTVPLGFLKRYE